MAVDAGVGSAADTLAFINTTWVARAIAMNSLTQPSLTACCYSEEMPLWADPSNPAGIFVVSAPTLITGRCVLASSPCSRINAIFRLDSILELESIDARF
ncbi:hypothetical protein OUZ56_016204 [Daphnia magna]|uniref:Uncharacterized protein n=1 Tax=Daphnia magna TaxID=35525 RepID=A0ABR0AQ13_9CRUS|nr:hypothetical protein OUZ56_016204 [Daphnia magna]